MLASEVSAHKQTQSELQRTRTSLQYLRSTTQNELKRKEKEFERVLDRFNKVSDAQIKLTGAYSGIRCANLVVGDEENVKGKSLMEDALEQAEEARKELVKENEGFRSVILSTANALQGMAYDVKGLMADEYVEEVHLYPLAAVVKLISLVIAIPSVSYSCIRTTDIFSATSG